MNGAQKRMAGQIRMAIRHILGLTHAENGIHHDSIVRTVVTQYRVKPSVVSAALESLEKDGTVERIGMGHRYRWVKG